MNNSVKAVALVSGGLDSSLAALLVKEQHVEVEGFFVKTPFNGMVPIEYFRETLGIPVTVYEAGEDYLALLKHPRFGYGKRANPCIDCHIYFLKKAAAYMRETGASFVVTGDVLGQRSMSQYQAMLERIEQEAGLPGLVLRPLSAKLLTETIPEQKRMVQRSGLLSISGRSRKEQLALADHFHLAQYAAPSAACLLTDPLFAARIKDWCAHDDLDFSRFPLIRVGRHFRIKGMRFILGRNLEENNLLQSYADTAVVLLSAEVPSPLGIFLDAQVASRDEIVMVAAEIVAAYSDARSRAKESLTVIVRSLTLRHREESVPVRPKADFSPYLIQ